MMGDSRRTQAERAADTRDTLIAAAPPVFAPPGVTEVTLETIVRDAGLRRGVLYHHFTDRTELFAAVSEQVEAAMAIRMGEAIAASGQIDPVEVIRLGAEIPPRYVAFGAI
jgi:AcrR family transcriptional regulator